MYHYHTLKNFAFLKGEGSGGGFTLSWFSPLDTSLAIFQIPFEFLNYKQLDRINNNNNNNNAVEMLFTYSCSKNHRRAK